MVWQKRYSPPGSSPGALHLPPEMRGEARITAIHYTSDMYTEKAITDLDDFLSTAPHDGVLWLNVDGLGDLNVLKKLGQHWDLHPLALEDVLNVPQRAKMEDYDQYAFLIFRMGFADQAAQGMMEQVSLFFGAVIRPDVSRRASRRV